MLTNAEVRELFRLVDRNVPLVHAARAIGRSERAARRYVKTRSLPSQMKKERTYRTRPDPFEDFWPDLAQRLKDAPGLEAKTLFSYLCRTHTEHFQEGQLRTLQRRVQSWRQDKARALVLASCAATNLQKSRRLEPVVESLNSVALIA